jgi:alkylation response protein AidB-like acyl-CoA dehydrogenase
MRLEPTDDERAIAEVFGGFFRAECPPAVVRAAEPLGFDPALWARLAGTGAPTMGRAEALGGGAGLRDLAVVAGQVGRTLAPVPFVEHAVALRLLDRVGGAPTIGDDDVVTLALRPAPPGGDWPLVPAGAVAGTVVGLVGDDLVCARTPAPGVAPANHAAMPVADRSPAGAGVLASGAAAHAAFTAARAEWQTLTAAALVGMVAAALDLAIAYVTDRHQFDRPIGSFQAIQQQLADLPIALEGATLLSAKAAWAGDREAPGTIDVDRADITDFPTLAAMAFLHAAEAAALATDRALHAHGGYGYAEEYDIQLYYRRARGWALVAGDPSRECRRLADTLFGPVEAVV